MPPNISNDTIIDRITHLHDAPIGPTKSDQKSILIIEDNTDIVEMYTMAFQTRGYMVASATNGLVGITQAVSLHPDIIILDIMMPEMDGFEVLETLKNNTNIRTKIIVNSNLE
jgi:DNA-binding response OmpR family regulator